MFGLHGLRTVCFSVASHLVLTVLCVLFPSLCAEVLHRPFAWFIALSYSVLGISLLKMASLS